MEHKKRALFLLPCLEFGILETHLRYLGKGNANKRYVTLVKALPQIIRTKHEIWLMSGAMRRELVVLVSLIMLLQTLSILPARSVSDEFPQAAVLGRYNFSQDNCWFVYNKTVQQLRTEGYDITGDDNWLLQVNYSRSGYTFKSKIIGLSWPNVTTMNLEGEYDLNTTAYRILDDGISGEELLSVVRTDQPAKMGMVWGCHDPGFGVGYDPSAFAIGNSFYIGTGGADIEYRVDRTEVLEGTWGSNQTYVLHGHLENSTHYYDEFIWCDANSGIVLRHLMNTRLPNLTHHEEMVIIETGVAWDEFDAVHNGEVCQFHVDTNSTLDSFSFDPSGNKANLILYGLTGTSGVCNVTIPKVLVPAGYGFEVLIDNQVTSYTLTEDTDNYYVWISYNHSTHTITISFVAAALWDQWWFWPTIGAVIVVVMILAYFFLKRRTKKTHNSK